MSNEERERIMRVGRNSLFASLVISGVATMFVFIVFYCTVKPEQADVSLTILPIIFNGIICYPLYRHFTNKELGMD